MAITVEQLLTAWGSQVGPPKGAKTSAELADMWGCTTWTVRARLRALKKAGATVTPHRVLATNIAGCNCIKTYYVIDVPKAKKK